MKTLTIGLIVCLMAGSSLGQVASGAKVPEDAKNDLKKRFPNASAANWSKEANGFEAEWKDNGREIAVVYDKRGIWVATEREIEHAILPDAVFKGLAEAMPGAQLLEAKSVERPNQSMAYELEVKQSGKVKEVLLDGEGKVLKTTNDEEGQEGDNDDDDGNDDQD